jgi:hypothetical protein
LEPVFRSGPVSDAPIQRERGAARLRLCISAIFRCVLFTVRDDRLGGSLASILRLPAML